MTARGNFRSNYNYASAVSHQDSGRDVDKGLLAAILAVADALTEQTKALRDLELAVRVQAGLPMRREEPKSGL